MKKIIYLGLVSLLTISVCACSDDDEPINPLQLPQAARTFLAQFFPTYDVRSVEKDGHHDDTEYTVTFTNGYEVEFDASGEWTDVDAPDGLAIPDGIAPATIAEYVVTYYPGDGINEISRDRRGYDVDLISGTDLVFTLAGDLVSIN